MGEGDKSPPKPEEKKDSSGKFTGADVFTMGSALLRVMGGKKAELPLHALQAGREKLLESTLPVLLISMQNPDPSKVFLQEASSKFSFTGQAMQLARKKINNPSAFSSIDNAKLSAYWRFPKANEFKSGEDVSVDAEAERAFCLLFRQGLSDEDRKNLSPGDLARLGPRAREPLSDAEEMLLKALTAKVLRERRDSTGIDATEKAELARCERDLLDHATWSKKLNDPADREIRAQVDEAYRSMVNARASALRLNLEDEYGGPRGKEFLTTIYEKTPVKESGPGGDRLVYKVKPGFEDAVLLPNGDIVRDPVRARELVARGEALSREELLYGRLLNVAGWSGKTHDQQEAAINESIGKLFGTEKKTPGGNDPKVAVLPFGSDDGKSATVTDDDNKSFAEKWVGPALKFLAVGGGITYGVAEWINIYRQAAAGKKFPAPLILRALGAIKDKVSGPRVAPDEVAARLGNDNMFRPRTRDRFRRQAESTIEDLDVATNPEAAGERVGKFMNDFAALERLDPRVARGRLNVEVEFTADPVAQSDGMRKAAVTFSETGGETTMKVTFPADASAGDIAHDCYASLYELERSGKGARRQLTRADRLSISSDFADLGVDTSRARSGNPVADALPDTSRGAAPDPVVIAFAADGVTIGEHKYSVKEISEAIREEFDERVKKLKRAGKKAGDADYDSAAKDLADHDQNLRNLDSTDRTVSRAARKAILDEARERYASDDGVRARAMAEDPRRGGDKGKGRMMTLLLFAEKYATPAAALVVGLFASPDSAHADDAPVKPAELVPIIPVKKEKE